MHALPSRRPALGRTQIDETLRRVFRDDAGDSLPRHLRTLLGHLDEPAAAIGAGRGPADAVAAREPGRGARRR